MSFRIRWSSSTNSRIASGSGTLPLALESAGGLALGFRCGSTCGLDRIGGRTKVVRGHVCDDPGLSNCVRSMPCCPTKVLAAPIAWPPAARACIIVTSPRAHARACSIAFARSSVIRLNGLEGVKDVLGAQRRPESEEMVIRIIQGPTAAIVTKRGSRTVGKIIGWALPLSVSAQPSGRQRAGTPPPQP